MATYLHSSITPATNPAAHPSLCIHHHFLAENSSSVEEMLGNQGVTESNMMQYLGIIEMRTSEILQMYAASQANMAGTDSVVHSIQNGIVQPAAPRLNVMPPAWEDFSSGEESDAEDDERPLTREELQRKTLRGMGKKESKHMKGAKMGKAMGR